MLLLLPRQEEKRTTRNSGHEYHWMTGSFLSSGQRISWGFSGYQGDTFLLLLMQFPILITKGNKFPTLFLLLLQILSQLPLWSLSASCKTCNWTVTPACSLAQLVDRHPAGVSMSERNVHWPSGRTHWLPDGASSSHVTQGEGGSSLIEFRLHTYVNTWRSQCAGPMLQTKTEHTAFQFSLTPFQEGH